MKKLFFIIVFTSCWKSEKEAKNECFLNHVGEYQFDIQKTISEFGSLGPYANDSLYLSDFRVFFKPDSTFYMNKKVNFFSDTIGRWESGTCGFESPGSLRYNSSPAIEQFGPCQVGDSFFTKLAPYNKKYGTITLWFKRCLSK